MYIAHVSNVFGSLFAHAPYLTLLIFTSMLIKSSLKDTHDIHHYYNYSILHRGEAFAGR